MKSARVAFLDEIATYVWREQFELVRPFHVVRDIEEIRAGERKVSVVEEGESTQLTIKIQPMRKKRPQTICRPSDEYKQRTRSREGKDGPTGTLQLAEDSIFSIAKSTS